ncbi:fibronectin type 3 and ankyrin repeat domains protein 1-like [Schistocerca piceifrons]|uniref:fibronectin type 3 and ankyrin repeat domains protein 1-like n=1 Tax=Schistocerca piceifrons TaxID=274613 RepID=UPI001F5F4253|nr:fibronectin type 3 and ankyrin repeat domains protein 1-like [Schistocerca piceifrons]
MSNEHTVELQAPAKPSVVSRDRYSVTLSWNPPEGLQASNGDRSIVYTLQMHDRVRGWVTVYWGHRTREQVRDLPPGGCAHFRLRASLDDRHSPWGATFAASTTEDQVAVVKLERAVAAGKTAVVKKVLASRPSAAELMSRGGVSPLAQASLRGDALTVSLLLAAGADADRAGGGAGRTPLMLAAAQGHLDVCTMLLERGASWDTKDWSGCTPLHYAVDASQLDVVRLALDSGADIDARDNQGWTPLMRGVSMESSEEVLRELVGRGASLDAEDRRGQTALMQAVLATRRDAVSILLAAGAGRKRRNLYGNTALDMARARNLKEIVRLLMNAEDDARNGKRKATPEEKDLQQQDARPSSHSAMVLASAKAKEVAL